MKNFIIDFYQYNNHFYPKLAYIRTYHRYATSTSSFNDNYTAEHKKKACHIATRLSKYSIFRTASLDIRHSQQEP